MTDPPRLMQDNGGLGGRLLRSARADGVPSDARQRTLVALGLGAGATVTTGAAAGTSAALTSGAVAKASLVLLVAKVAVTGAVLTALTVTVVHHVRTSTPPAARVPGTTAKSAPQAVLSAVPAFAPASSAPALLPTSSAFAPVAALPEHRSSALSARSAAVGGAAAVDLTQEVAALDEAREALASGQSERALSIVNQYERGTSAKTLLLEAQVLRIEALAQRGDAARAAKLAQAFLAEHPSSAHAARVRSLLLATQKSIVP